MHVLLDAPRRRVIKLLSASRIVWSLTGFQQSGGALGQLADRLDRASSASSRKELDHGPNPADAEHFGIAVTEAMSAGAIPVLLSMGGLPELVPSSAGGRLAANVSEVVASTLEVLSQSDEQLDAMSAAALVASKRFTGKVFEQRLKAIIRKGHLARFSSGTGKMVCTMQTDQQDVDT